MLDALPARDGGGNQFLDLAGRRKRCGDLSAAEPDGVRLRAPVELADRRLLREVPPVPFAVSVSFADSGRACARPVRAPLGSVRRSDTLRLVLTDALAGPSRNARVTGLPCLRLPVFSVTVPPMLTRAAWSQRTLS